MKKERKMEEGHKEREKGKNERKKEEPGSTESGKGGIKLGEKNHRERRKKETKERTKKARRPEKKKKEEEKKLVIKGKKKLRRIVRNQEVSKGRGKYAKQERKQNRISKSLKDQLRKHGRIHANTLI